MKTTNKYRSGVAPNKQLSEPQFERFVSQEQSASGERKNLVPFLREQHFIYKGKSGDAVIRMRAYIFYTFYLTNTPEEALMFIYEELESGKDPYLIATAAMALRNCEQKRDDMGRVLLTALKNARYFDSTLSLGSYYPKWPAKNETTALSEILKSLCWLGAYTHPYLEELKLLYRDESQSFNTGVSSRLQETIHTIETDKTITEKCCGPIIPGFRPLKTADKPFKKSVYDIVKLEDQDGQETNFSEFLGNEKFVLIAFFYTRCDNPLKCSLTITNLARIQNKALSRGWANQLALAGISYDGNYDGPDQLRRYGEARGIHFNGQTRFFRIVNNADALISYFDLSVNYAGDIVNRHTVELYLIAPGGDIVTIFQRAKIDNDQVIAEIEAAIEKHKAGQKNWKKRLRTAFSSVTSLAGSAIIVILPKCPLCFAVYFSMLGIAGAPLLPYVKYIFPLLVIVIAVNLFLIYRAAKKRNGYLPFYMAAFGAVLIIVFYKIYHVKFAEAIGFLLLFTASILNAIPNRLFLKLSLWTHNWAHQIKEWMHFRVLPGFLQNMVKQQ